jgi:tight adherence protein C
MRAVLALMSGLDWQLGAMALATMAAVVAAAAGVRAMFSTPRDEVIERIDRVVGRSEDVAGATAGQPGLWTRLVRPFVALARPTRADELSRLRLRLVQAGLRSEHAMELFLASKLILAAGATLLFLYVNGRLVHGLVFPNDAAVAVWLCGGGFLGPSLWLRSRITQRQTILERSLPDAMDLLVTCVEAGLGLDAALARIADEMKAAAPLLCQELNLTFLEVQAGIPRRDAFRRLAERTGVEDLRRLSAVLVQTELFGTSIAKALRIHADGMRVRRMQRAEERAATVGVKMTLPLVFCILPSLMAIVVGPAVVAIVTQFLKTGP